MNLNSIHVLVSGIQRPSHATWNTHAYGPTPPPPLPRERAGINKNLDLHMYKIMWCTIFSSQTYTLHCMCYDCLKSQDDMQTCNACKTHKIFNKCRLQSGNGHIEIPWTYTFASCNLRMLP